MPKKIKADKERIVQYGQIMERTLRDWETYSGKVSLKSLQENRPLCLFLCYAMEATIQTALDIANHLIAANGWEKPGSYRETFEILMRRKFITASLTKNLKELAGFRNILLHRYPELKIPLVHRHLKNSHKSLRAYLRLIGKV